MLLIRDVDIRDAIYELLCYGPATYREISVSLGLHLRTVKVVVRDHFGDMALIHGDIVALASFWHRPHGGVTLASIHCGPRAEALDQKPNGRPTAGTGGAA